MIYTNKNSKISLRARGFILLFLFFMVTTKTYIQQADFFVNDKIGQKIICLGDCHVYPVHWKGTEKENVTREQQKAIIEFAKKSGAIILIEPSGKESAFFKSVCKEEREPVSQKVIKSNASVKVESAMHLLYPLCIVNNIPCEDIDCRVSADCWDSTTNRFLLSAQKIIDAAKKTAKAIEQFDDEQPFKKIYQKELDKFNTDFPKFKKLKNKLGKYSDTSLANLKELIRTKQIKLSDNDLHAFVSFYNKNVPVDNTVANNIKKLINYAIDMSHKINPRNVTNYSQPQRNRIEDLIDLTFLVFPRFLEMHILHAIAQNKKKPIIVVTGYAHADRIAQLLQQCNYRLQKSIGEKAKKSTTIGSIFVDHTGPLVSLDLKKIFGKSNKTNKSNPKSN